MKRMTTTLAAWCCLSLVTAAQAQLVGHAANGLLSKLGQAAAAGGIFAGKAQPIQLPGIGAFKEVTPEAEGLGWNDQRGPHRGGGHNGRRGYGRIERFESRPYRNEWEARNKMRQKTWQLERTGYRVVSSDVRRSGHSRHGRGGYYFVLQYRRR